MCFRAIEIRDAAKNIDQLQGEFKEALTCNNVCSQVSSPRQPLFDSLMVKRRPLSCFTLTVCIKVCIASDHFLTDEY